MKRFVAMCGLVMLGACGTNPIGRLLESEGIAHSDDVKKATTPPQGTRKGGFPADQDEARPRPTLAGKWMATWADPLYIEQDGDRVYGKFDRNGTFDCTWNQKSRFDCSWKSDQGKGLAQLWWDHDRPGGHWMNEKWGDWVEMNFLPWTDSERGPGGTSTSQGASPLGGPCVYNQNCADPDTRCWKDKCVSSPGTKCSGAGDCSRVSNQYDCVRGVCTVR